MKIIMTPLLKTFGGLIALGSFAFFHSGCSHATGEAELERGPRNITLTGDDIQYVHAGDVEVQVLRFGDEISVQVDYRDSSRVYDIKFSPEAIRSHTKVEKDGGMFVVVDEDGDGFSDLKSEFRPERKLYRIIHSFEAKAFPED